MQRCCSPHDEGVLAVSSTSSGRQLRKPDDHMCWGGETVPPTDDEQQNADAAWRQLKRPEHSTSPGTGERIHWDTGMPSRWAYTWHVQVRHVQVLFRCNDYNMQQCSKRIKFLALSRKPTATRKSKEFWIVWAIWSRFWVPLCTMEHVSCQIRERMPLKGIIVASVLSAIDVNAQSKIAMQSKIDTMSEVHQTNIIPCSTTPRLHIIRSTIRKLQII